MIVFVFDIRAELELDIDILARGLFEVDPLCDFDLRGVPDTLGDTVGDFDFAGVPVDLTLTELLLELDMLDEDE